MRSFNLATSRTRFFRTSTFRLSLLYIALFGISMIAVLLFIYLSTVQNMIRLTDDSINQELNDVLAEYKSGGTKELKSTLETRIGDARVGGWVYLLTDEAFRPVLGNLPAWPVASTQTGKWLRFTMDEARRGEHHAVRALSLALPSGQLLLVGRDIRQEENFTETMWHAALWAGVLTLLLGIGGGFYMSRNMLKRLDVLTRGAERIMRGGVAARMPTQGSDDEFDRLAKTLNAMLGEIERLIHSIRGVTTNLAHDLRSPLTRIKSRLELSLGRAGNAETLRDEMAYAIGETDQLLVTFNALLSIAEAEGGAARANLAPVDLAQLVEDVADLYGPIAEDKGLALTFAHDGEVTVLGHRQLLFQALLNLIDNAIKYTVRGGITVTSTAQPDGHVVLTIADTGPGIPAADRARVLEQFVRLDESRTTRGNGLGLSLVAAIARLHAADLTLSDNEAAPERQGLKVSLNFRHA